MRYVIIVMLCGFSITLLCSENYGTYAEKKEVVDQINRKIKDEASAIRSMSLIDSITCCQQGANCCDHYLVQCVSLPIVLCCSNQPESGSSYSICCGGCCVGIANPCVWWLSIERCCKEKKESTYFDVAQII